MDRAEKFQDALFELLNDLRLTSRENLDGGADCFVDMVGEVASVRTYPDAHLLTMDKGIVLRLKNGDEFQLTIRLSERGKYCDDCGNPYDECSCEEDE